MDVTNRLMIKIVTLVLRFFYNPYATLILKSWTCIMGE